MQDRKILNRDYTYYLNIPNNVVWAYLADFLNNEECDKIIAAATQDNIIESYLVGGVVDNDIRKNRVVFLPSHDDRYRWAFDKIARCVINLNKQFWNFDLTFVETLQFTIYNREQDFYTAHMDTSHNNPEQRKLSFVVQLSDPTNYTGSDLQIHSCGLNFFNTVRNRGAIIAFPSYMVHRVTPLLSGTRYSLVGWVCGPPYK
jgi:PKHD-type hydroxylase